MESNINLVAKPKNKMNECNFNNGPIGPDLCVIRMTKVQQVGDGVAWWLADTHTGLRLNLVSVLCCWVQVESENAHLLHSTKTDWFSSNDWNREVLHWNRYRVKIRRMVLKPLFSGNYPFCFITPGSRLTTDSWVLMETYLMVLGSSPLFCFVHFCVVQTFVYTNVALQTKKWKLNGCNHYLAKRKKIPPKNN